MHVCMYMLALLVSTLSPISLYVYSGSTAFFWFFDLLSDPVSTSLIISDLQLHLQHIPHVNHTDTSSVSASDPVKRGA